MTTPDLRAMDLRLAEKCMGWRWWTRHGHRWFGPPNSPEIVARKGYDTIPAVPCGTDQMDDKIEEEPWWMGGYGEYPDEIVPHYTTDAVASKQLREKLLELGYHWTMRSPVEDCPHFYFRIRPTGCAVKDYEVEAETEELAVALCALRSVGIEP